MKRKILLIVVMVLTTLVWPQHAAVAQEDEHAECEAQHALFLIDESGSLRRSDPEARRVDAAKLVVEALSPQAAGRAPVVLTVAGFGSSYRAYAELRLPEDREQALREVEEFRERNANRNTDYVAALRAASAHFASVEAPAHCKTLLWFTDGGHDVQFPDDPDSQAASYTRATDSLEITRQLEALVCGPLPETSLLGTPVREEMIRAGFQTVISELQAGTPSRREQERLAITHPVLNRLVRAPGDSCQVPGSWTTVKEPEELASQFFDDAQASLGRESVPCDILTGGGLRSDLVGSMAFRVEGTRDALLRVGDELEPLTGSVFERDVPTTARSTGAQIQVTSSGNVVNCHLELEVELRLGDEPVLFKGATETAVDFVVAGPDFTERRSVGPDLVGIEVTVEGAPVEARFDPDRRVWTAFLPKSSADALDLSAVASLRSGTELARLETLVPVSDVPPAPSVAWMGDEVFEGSGALRGAVRVTPTVTVASAQYCVSFPEAKSPVTGSDGTSHLALLQVEDGRHCGPAAAGEPFDVPAEVIVETDANATGVLRLQVHSTYLDASGVELVVSDAEPLEIGRVSLIRAPDRVRELLVVAILVAASVLFPLLLLWYFNSRYGRLRPPSKLSALPLTVELVRREHPGTSSSTFILQPHAECEIKLADLKPVHGSRRRWNLPSGFNVERRLPLNPFGSPAARLSSDRGRLVSSVARTQPDGTVTGPIALSDFVVVAMPSVPPSDSEPLLVTAVLVAEQGRTVPHLEKSLETALQRCGPHIQLVDERRSQPSAGPPEPPPAATSSGPSEAPIAEPFAFQGASGSAPPPPPPRNGETPSGPPPTPPKAPPKTPDSKPPPTPPR